MYLQMRHPHMEYPRIELWGIVAGVVHAEGYRDRGVIPSKDSSKPIKSTYCLSWTTGRQVMDRGDADGHRMAQQTARIDCGGQRT
jgi:hypothetical protein